ncbi:MAG: phosphohydrolase [Bacteroidetes bacterium]|nr:MAG: phosphohydrolase [Bacteroidota bacterium]RLD92048.1 MAG: phosphohydrolase [Bacteroidota bacterium]
MSETIIQNTVAFVKLTLSGAEGGHDWYHIERVWNTARYIREQEGSGDLLTIELAALLHDISDAKFNGGDDEIGSRMASEFLLEQDVDREILEHVQAIIKHVSYKGGFSQDQISTIEFHIVQDADRLDAIGAVGIARAFNYGGFKNRPIHKPEMPLQEYKDSKAYHKSDAPTINHFYEKLLKLKDLMNTSTGLKMAEERHTYMLDFLDRFYREWNPGK